ncbi:MAG: SH3 domain-containing protein [Chloroflexota bacterium]
MGLLLLLAGAFFGLSFILNAVIQSIRKQTRIGFFQTLLMFLVVLLPLLALVGNQLSENPIQMVSTAALVVAGILMVLSLILMLFELRRPDRLKQSRGVMGIGAGLLLVIATFSVPLSANIALNAKQSTTTPLVVAAENTAEAGVSSAAIATATRTPTASATPTITPTRKPRPTITPVATRFQFVTRTPPPTATLPNPCLALANYNINLRAKPEADAEVLATIPYNNTLTLFGRNADSSWWYGEYDGKSGWVKGEFISPSSSCADLPERPVQ